MLFFDQIRSKANLVEIVNARVSLKRRGRDYWGVCPFHSEKTPSFTVSATKNFYHCFGCGAHGDVIKFLSEVESMSYKDAAIKLASLLGIDVPFFEPNLEMENLYESMNLAKNIFVLELEKNNFAREYLSKRGVHDDFIKKFELGYASDNILSKYINPESLRKLGLLKENYEMFRRRIIFPIKNSFGKIVGFGGRSLDKDLMPKYLNSPETVIFQKNEILYGENLAFGSSYKKGYTIVVEGYLDTILMHQHGFCNTVATLGTAISKNHISKLWKGANEIVLCMDGDEAGQRATFRALDLIIDMVSVDQKVTFIELPKDSDPDDFLRSGSKFDGLINNRLSLSTIIWKKCYHNQKSPEEIASLRKQIYEYIKRIKDPILKDSYIVFFKQKISNIFKKKNLSTFSNINLNVDSKIDYIEQQILGFLIKYPHYLSEEQIKEEFCKIKFVNPEHQEIASTVLQNSKYSEVIFKDLLDKIVNVLITDEKEFWEHIIKKHQLELLKIEYEKSLLISESLAQSLLNAIISLENTLANKKQ